MCVHTSVWGHLLTLLCTVCARSSNQCVGSVRVFQATVCDEAPWLKTLWHWLFQVPVSRGVKGGNSSRSAVCMCVMVCQLGSSGL